ncbi:hypothetical protein OOK44_35575 [Streptomyces cellulosae]|uniref:AAA+ ATPase domain-containing protein n=1 Tax=Streptomyces althioticus TaxID=83380 RepID=A0ABZ1YJF0_9ACTN|nr:hypothetical protein [Streptomyces sp.]MCX4481696.1 hypothetical protein [Streptomyces cellulosae]WTB93323.1 hypothetical protein OIE99_34325 [Streptomyces cellulosae]WTC60715.1 hypothetical protein OH715_36080 [Streptomyces cellulosae]
MDYGGVAVLLKKYEAKAPSRLVLPVGVCAGEELMLGLAWDGEHVLISGEAGTGKTVMAGRFAAAARRYGWSATVLDGRCETVPDPLPGGILDVMQAIADGAAGEPCVVVIDHAAVAGTRELAALMAAPGVHVVLVTHPSPEAVPVQWIPDDPDAGWPMRLLRFGHRMWLGPGRAGLDVPRFLQVPETLGLLRRAAGVEPGSGVYASAGLGPTRFAALPLW